MKRLEVDELIIGTNDGPQLRLQANEINAYDTQGHPRFRLLIERGGIPTLTLCDGNGTDRVCIRVEENGCPAIRLRDGNFTERVALELGADEGEPEVSFYDRSGRCFALVGQDHQGELKIRVADEAGHFQPWVPRTEDATEQQATKRRA